MYQRFPGDGAGPGEPSTTMPMPMPQSVQRAVRVMYAGAAASLIGIAVDLTALSAIRSALTKRNTAMTAAQLNTASHVEVGILIAIILLWQRSSTEYFRGAPRY